MIEIQAVEKTYPNGFQALHEVNLKIEPGEFFSLLGASGCGKTTLLRIIAGLIDPTKGRIYIDGKDVTEAPPNQRRVNMVFQSYAVFPHMSVFNNIAYGLKVERVPMLEIKERVKQVLKLVKLEGREDNMPDQLSGGQRQRVAVARALVKRPKALLLDEPLSALDAKLRESMRSELIKIQKEAGITFIFVTHDQSEALSLANKIAVMNEGRIVQYGAPYDIYEAPNTKFVADFIGSTNLLNAVQKRIDGLHEVTVEGIEPFKMSLEDDWPDTFHLALRPEKISLKTGDRPAAPNISIAGAIEEIIYFGEKTHVKVRLVTNERLSVFLADYERKLLGSFKENDAVFCYWETSDLRPLRD